MNIAAHLICAKPPKQVAQMYIKQLEERSHETNALCLELALQLPQTIFIVIGFPCVITPEQVRRGSYEWPNTLPIYTFPFNAVLFRPLAIFLTHMSFEVQQLQQSDDQAVGCSILTFYLELLDLWHNIYKDLEEQDSQSVSRRFEEPLARVNFCLLLGLHPLRKLYRLEFQQLDDLCDRLYRSAVQGIFYPECHLDVVEGLSSLFSQDFHIFYQHAPDSLNFFFDALSVVNQKLTYIKTFQMLTKMLEHEEDWTPNQVLILTNYLIEEKMQEAYFSNLKFGKTKRLLMAVLEFLKVLQSKLPTVDCFPKPFIESLWPLMLNKDATIATLAAEVYVTIMRRKFNDHLILKHIMEGYYSTTSTTDVLSSYIATLWPIFPVICNVDEYVEIIKSPRTDNTFRSYSAYFFVYVFRQMWQDFVKYREHLEHLLLLLPNLLEKLTCQVTSGILIQIYAALSFDDLKNKTPKADEIICLFENYAIETFTVARCEYPLMFNLFGQLNRCLTYTKNWPKLEQLSIIIYNNYREIEQSLNNESVSLNTLRNYKTSLQKLTLLLTTGYDILDNLVDVVVRIRERLISKPQMNEFVARSNCFLDVYAIDILTLGLTKLATATLITEREKDFIKTLAEQLTRYLLTFIRNVKDLPKMPIVRIKTIFSSFLDLHCLFHGKCLVHQIKFTAHTYFILVEALILINFNTKEFCCDGDEQMHSHPLRNMEYQTMLFEKFIKLHDNENVEIPTNVAWKLCIYYGLSGHKFNTQLAKLLKTIASKHPKMYKHILPVLVYNLYKRRPTLNEHAVLQAIKAHKKLINTELKLENPHVIKVHIVLTVLQIINKSVQVLQLNSIVNRLVALKHLTILVEDIKWTDKSILEMILKQASEIKANLLTPFEGKALQTFMDFFEKQKT